MTVTDLTPVTLPCEPSCSLCGDTGVVGLIDRQPCICDARPFEAGEVGPQRPAPMPLDLRAVLRLETANKEQCDAAVALDLAIDRALQVSNDVLGQLVRCAEWRTYLQVGPPAAAGQAVASILGDVDPLALAAAIVELRAAALTAEVAR